MGPVREPNPNAASQAVMYNALTPLFDHVTSNDLFTDFKSEKLWVDTDGPTTQAVPFPGVTLLRDRFNVPHVSRAPGGPASRRPAGSSPRTAGCCSNRPDTTRASRSSTRQG